LVGESLQQIHQGVGKAADLRPPDGDRADCEVLATEWHSHHAAYPCGVRELLIAEFWILLQVAHMNDRAVHNCAHRQ
jgi:hypothetical protein